MALTKRAEYLLAMNGVGVSRPWWSVGGGIAAAALLGWSLAHGDTVLAVIAGAVLAASIVMVGCGST